MLDFEKLTACTDFADLDLGVLAESQREEAEYLSGCADEASRLHLPDGFEGTRAERTRLLVRAYDAHLRRHLLAYMASHPAQSRAFLLSLRGASTAQPVLQRAGRLFLAVANPEPAAEPMVATR